MSEINIMVVEDSPDTQKTIKDIFEFSFEGSETPCKVLVASSGEQAFIELNKGYIPNFIVLDINLPGIKGGMVIQKLKSDPRWKNIPVFPFSSLWDENSNKPFDEHAQTVKEWYESIRKIDNSGGTPILGVTPKFNGQDNTTILNPNLIIFAASTLIRQGITLTDSFKALVCSSYNMVGEMK